MFACSWARIYPDYPLIAEVVVPNFGRGWVSVDRQWAVTKAKSKRCRVSGKPDVTLKNLAVFAEMVTRLPYSVSRPGTSKSGPEVIAVTFTASPSPRLSR
jgi:hypothetical protein